MAVFHLHARLSGFYLCYFATLGVLLPYWGLYLQSLGLEPDQIGELMAILLATKLVAPNVWGWIADRTGWRMGIIRLGCLAAAVTFLGVYWATDSFARLAVVMFLFSFFWNAVLPQFEAATLNHLGRQVHRYSKIRLWGSVGFILTSTLLGLLLQAMDLDILPQLLLALFIGIWLISLAVPTQQPLRSCVQSGPLGEVLRQPQVLALLLVCFLIQASHGPYYAFFSIYLDTLGYRSGLIGVLWSLGVVAELGVFMLMHRLLPRFGARRLMLITLALTALRWLLISTLANKLVVLLFAQSLHAFSFGVCHAVAIHLIHQFFVGAHQGRGQALYSSMSFGAGGGFGNLAAGYLWICLGPESTYLLAAAFVVLGFVVAWRYLRV